MTVLFAHLLLAAPQVLGGPLSLDEAVNRALVVNERPEIANAQVREARAAYRLAWSRLLPTVSISGTYRRRAFEVAAGDAVFQAQDALATEGRASMRLLDASAIPDIRAAGATREAAKASAIETKRRLAFETAEAFYAALAADRTAEAAQRRVDLAAATSSNAQARFEAGLVARGELNRTRLDEAQARQSRAVARRDRRLARIALGFLIGAEPQGPLEVPQRPKPLTRPTPFRRPDIEAAQLLVLAAERAVWAPWLRLLPTVDVIGSVRTSNERGFQEQQFTWDVAFTATWVLYDGGNRYAEASVREAQARQSRLQLENLQRSADVELARASADLDASLRILTQAETQAQLAEENRDEVDDRFAKGLATAIEVTDGATNAFDAKVALEQARFQAAIAALSLRLAAGGWPTSDAPP